jgi:hypothetical protein
MLKSNFFSLSLSLIKERRTGIGLACSLKGGQRHRIGGNLYG